MSLVHWTPIVFIWQIFSVSGALQLWHIWSQCTFGRGDNRRLICSRQEPNLCSDLMVIVPSLNPKESQFTSFLLETFGIFRFCIMLCTLCP